MKMQTTLLAKGVAILAALCASAIKAGAAVTYVHEFNDDTAAVKAIGTMPDTIAARPDTIAADTVATKAGHGLVARLLRYFAESDKPKADKKIDFGIIGGPHYATDTGL